MNKKSFELFGSPRLSALRMGGGFDAGVVVDIGSGSGVSSILFLRALDEKVGIVLTDPRPELHLIEGMGLELSGVTYCSQPTTVNDLINDRLSTTNDRFAVSAVNCLHHMSDSAIEGLFDWSARRKARLYIVDARRLHWMHPLLIPFVFFPFYFGLAWFGSGRKFFSHNIFRRLVAAALEAYIMSVDQAIGSARRLSADVILAMASSHGMRTLLVQDWLMNYFLLIPSEERIDAATNG